MPLSPWTHAHDVPHAGILKRLLGDLSLFTMVMTIPPGSHHMDQARGGRRIDIFMERVPHLCGRLALVRLQKRDKNIYLACIGWILLDTAVIVGTFVYSQ